MDVSNFSVDVNMRIKDLTFFNEILVKGRHNFSRNWETVTFNHHIQWDISTDLITKDKRMITFLFGLKMLPNIEEMMFEGKCILKSPVQQNITFIHQNAPHVLDYFIYKFLLRNSYINAERFAKEQLIPFPPVKLILMRFGLNNVM